MPPFFICQQLIRRIIKEKAPKVNERVPTHLCPNDLKIMMSRYWNI